MWEENLLEIQSNWMLMWTQHFDVLPHSWGGGQGGSWMGVKCWILIPGCWQRVLPPIIHSGKKEEGRWVSRRESTILKRSLRVSLARTDLRSCLAPPNKPHLLPHRSHPLGTSSLPFIAHVNKQQPSLPVGSFMELNIPAWQPPKGAVIYPGCKMAFLELWVMACCC